jgi:chemotaxis-related protein WspB
MESNHKMLIMCHAGTNRYAFQSQDVLEVLPHVNLHRLADSPAWLAGLLIFRGTAIPVIDLVQFTQSGPCPNRLSSRIAIIHITVEGITQRFGVLAEQMDLHEFNAGDTKSGAESGEKTSLGILYLDEQGVFQIINPARLLSEERLSILFPNTAEQR